MRKILVTGATGQLGSALTVELRERFGAESVIAAGHLTSPLQSVRESGPYVTIDVCDRHAVEDLVRTEGIDTIYHLAAILSATGEDNPQLAWEVNMDGLRNVLEAARAGDCSLFFPSSIGAFGPATPPENTPQDTIQRPQTMYGITKVAGELLCDYYFSAYGVDTRGLRYPGLISYDTLPGGGTTDYAVEIFYGALTAKHYTCFLAEGTRLDMMYMPDAVRAAMELMEADLSRLKHRNAFNVTAMSAAPEDFYREIRKYIPEFTMDYSIDPVRQKIAESWPRHMDDSAAREEWSWSPRYDLAAMTGEMMTLLGSRLQLGGGGYDEGLA